MILNALRKVIDPDLHADIVSLGFIKNLALSDGRVSFAIELTTPACPAKDKLHEEARQAVSAVPGVKEVNIKMTSKVTSTKDGRETKLLPDVKNIIPIASGKGGVGKSTVSVNIALALKRAGASVGLLDADIYGPSVPQIMGVSYEPKAAGNDMILPAEHHGIKIMSMGFFTQQNQAVIWRGPMLGKMVEQFLGSVEWGSLDYLVIDLPPGTGDVQLTLCQSIPLTGAVIVSTPQDVALNVARRAILMFNKLNAPVIGIIENMSYYVCSHCGEKERIFGEGGVAKASREFGIPFLGEIPLTTSIREKSDAGKPVVIFDPDSEETKVFTAISENIAAQISIQNLAEKKRK
ncbi:chromosome partitioning protein [bacterium SM23_31]|nr:MAG: chromosome partitioning protein [bacterium SM23_31]